MNYLLVVDDSLTDRRVAGQLLSARTGQHVKYASNGVDALELLEQGLPMALVTDLQMPEMDGLELIQAVRERFPSVPVILMTAHGSEEIAMQALLRGAADYVPKAQLVSELARAVEGVLAITAGARTPPPLAQHLRYQELRYELENDTRLIPPLVERLQQVAADLGLVSPADRVRFAKALIEALRNAIYHGNLELSAELIGLAGQASSPAAAAVAQRRGQLPYRDRRVHVRAVFTPAEGRFTIADDGPGFNHAELPDVKADPRYLSRGRGRGLVLIEMFMDEVRFNPPGNEITLVKRAGTQHTAA